MRAFVDSYVYEELDPKVYVEQALNLADVLGIPRNRLQLMWITATLSSWTGAYSDQVVLRLIQGLRTAKIRSFAFRLFREGHGFRTMGGVSWFAVGGHVLHDHAGRAIRLNSVLDESLGTGLGLEGQRIFVAACKSMWRAVSAVHGYMIRGEGLSSVGSGNTYYEGVRRLTGPEPSLLYLHEIGAYSWGTLLSDGHVASLGGVERVLREAPVAVAEVLSENEPLQVYLQLTPDIRKIDREELVALRRFLTPVLRKSKRYDPRFLSSYDLVEDAFVEEEGAEPIEVMVPVSSGLSKSPALPKVEERPSRASVPEERQEPNQRWPFGLEKGVIEGVDAQFRFRFVRPLTHEEGETFSRLLRAWYEVGTRGGFGGHLHDMGYEKVDEGRIWAMWVDMGSAPGAAEPLLDMIAGFCRENNVTLERVRVGEFAEDD